MLHIVPKPKYIFALVTASLAPTSFVSRFSLILAASLVLIAGNFTFTCASDTPAVGSPSVGLAPAVSGSAPTLDTGYRHMYNLQFEEARGTFHQWQQMHPSDPLGWT